MNRTRAERLREILELIREERERRALVAEIAPLVVPLATAARIYGTAKLPGAIAKGRQRIKSAVNNISNN